MGAYASPTAKDGDPCTGFSGGNTTTGKLARCAICSDVDTYAGREGTPCVGFRSDRTSVAGKVDCSNLAFDCKRGVASACAALAAHK